jgi:hypothetical protein
MVVAVGGAHLTPQWLSDDLHSLQRRIEGRRRPQKIILTAEEHLAFRERVNKEESLKPNHADDTKVNILLVKKKWIKYVSSCLTQALDNLDLT